MLSIEVMKISFSVYILLSIPMILIFHFMESKNVSKQELLYMYITIMLFWLPSFVVALFEIKKQK